MRMLLEVKIPNEGFNDSVRDGSAGAKIQRILEATKPEAVYFTEHGGVRGGLMVINLNDVSEIPSYAEPWFLEFNAKVEFHPVMTPEDLAKAGLEQLGKTWG